MRMQENTLVPDGINTVNPFIITKNASEVIEFITKVFGGKEDKEALTYDTDGLIIHSEVRVGNSTIMLGDQKKEWRFTPAFLQVYVSDVEATLKRAEDCGAKIITKPTEYIGVKFSRFQDPCLNIWWVWEKLDQYDWEAAYGESDEESWQPTEESIYIYDTLITAMNKLAKD